jgi:DNA (cytosine-5)-methyltransferase 1
MEQIDIFELIMPSYKINKPIRLIELFAGIGSQIKSFKKLQKKYGFELESYKVIEFDKYAIASYNAINGTDFKPMDITKITADDLNIFNTNVYEYILTYSFPCQDLSLAGKQRGMKKGSKTRSGLLWEVERLLNECSELPQILLMENVPQVISSNNMDDFRQWQLKLEKLGYTNYVSLLNAKDYGVPQNRNRCFMISFLGQYSYKFPKPFKLKTRLKDMLEDEVDEKYYLSDELTEKIRHRLGDKEYNLLGGMHKNQSFKDDGISTTLTSSMINEPVRKYGIFDDEKGIHQAGSVWDQDGLAPTLDTMQGRYRQPCIEIREKTKRGYKEAYEGDGVYLNRPHQKRGVVQNGMIQTLKTSCSDVGVVVSDKPICVGQVSTGNSQAGKVYSPDGVGQTLCAGTHGYAMGNIEHNLRIRKLTPLECFRLMGFDDEDFYKAEKVNSNTQLYKQAGNSIVVNVLEHIFNELF